MITMTHYMNVVGLSDKERGDLQNNEDYKNRLINQVLKMYSLGKLAATDFSSHSLEGFLPIIYYTQALCSYCSNKYDEMNLGKIKVHDGFNNNFNYRMLYKLLIKIKSCVCLADMKAVHELMVISRSLVELFMTYAILWDQDDKIINSYLEYDKYSFDNNYQSSTPEHIKIQAKDMGVKEINFLNYGWIKDLREFNTLSNKKNAFGVSGMAKILDKKSAYIYDNFGSDLYLFYKACNPQTHGTFLMMNYFQLELFIFQNISVMMKFLCEIMSDKLFAFEFKIGDLDLVDELNDVLAKSRKTYETINSNKALLEKTNLDYRDRAICCARMKM